MPSGLERRALNTLRSSLSALSTKTANSPQSFNVYIATGASDLWVASSACTTCNPDTTGFINASSSTLETAHKPGGEQIRVTLSYSIGIVAGDLVRDTVGMGDFLVPHQEWILVDQSPAGLLEGSAIGIMGLAFDTIAGTEATPFWQLLAQSGLLATPEMSFWLARHLGDQNAQDEDFGGIFTLGGQNQTLYTGDVEFFPLVVNAASGKKTLWLLNISGASLVCHYRVLASLTDVPQSQGSQSTGRMSPCRRVALLPLTSVKRSSAAPPPPFRRSTPRFPTPNHLAVTMPDITDSVRPLFY